MSSRQFIYLQDNGWSKEQSFAGVMTVAAKKLISGRGPFTLTDDGKPVVADGSRRKVLMRLRHLLSVGDVGPTYRVRNGKGDVIFAVRETKEAFRVINTNGNSKADLFWSWIVATYPQYHPRFGGAYACKSIVGSGGVTSQHSYGNACDVFFDTLSHQDVVYDAVKRGEAPLGIAHAISMHSIWEPGSGEHYYSGETHYHLHCDFIPQLSGGCGVRG